MRDHFGEVSREDAPAQYSVEESYAWAAGYNTAIEQVKDLTPKLPSIPKPGIIWPIRGLLVWVLIMIISGLVGIVIRIDNHMLDRQEYRAAPTIEQGYKS